MKSINTKSVTETEPLHAWQRAVASSGGAILTSLTMTPFDVIKVRLQSEKKFGKNNHHANNTMRRMALHALESSHYQWIQNGPTIIKQTCRQPLTCGYVTMCNSASNRNAIKPWHTISTNSRQTTTSRGAATHVIQSCDCHTNATAAASVVARRSTAAYVLNGNFYDAARMIVRHEGLRSLWSGMTPTMVMALPQTVIYYTVNDWLRDQLSYISSSSSMTNENKSVTQSKYLINSYDAIPALVGGASRVVTILSVSPLELARTKMQSTRMNYQQLLSDIRSTIHHRGVQSLWMGVGPSLLRDVPFSILFWFLFEYQRRLWNSSNWFSTLPTNDKHSLELRMNFIFGATAGTVAGLVTLPFDVVKTHRQIELGQSSLFVANSKPQSTWSTLIQLKKTYGFSALFTGITPRILKVAPACAIMIGTFELLKSHFRLQNFNDGGGGGDGLLNQQQQHGRRIN